VIVIMVIRFVPKDWPGLEWRVFDPLVVCGQQSARSVLRRRCSCLCGHFMLSLSFGLAARAILVSVAGISIMTIVAYYISCRRSRTKPREGAGAGQAG